MRVAQNRESESRHCRELVNSAAFIITYGSNKSVIASARRLAAA